MKSRSRKLIILTLLSLIGACLFFYRLKIRQIEKDVYLKTSAFQEIESPVFTEYSEGKKKMEVRAERFSIKPKIIGFFKTPLIKEAHIVKPELLFFKEGEKASHVTANSARMNMRNRRMFFKGDVVLVTADGKRLSSSEMAVDPKLGILSIKGNFVLNKNGEIIKGKGLTSDVGLEKINIKGN